jgi:outer membrane cobalamin receptor
MAAISRVVPTVLLLSLSAAANLSAAEIRGTIVDRSGKAVPRALVRVVDATGTDTSRTFADESGRFELFAPDTLLCRVVVELTGFEISEQPCRGEPLRIELAIAPLQETVLVSATRTDAPASQVGASATVFTAEDLERRQTPFVADLLATTPGAMLIRSGAPGTLTSLFVRGGESDYNKVLIDGVPLNEPGGSFYLNNLTTEHLDRLEVVRGAFSALYGSDAMASVIHLVTARPDRSSRRARGSAQIDGGTYATLHMNASVAGAAGRFDYSLGAAQFNSDHRTPNSRLENTTLNANVGFALSTGASLRFVGRGELEHVGTPGPTAYGRPDLDAFFERSDSVAGFTFDQQLTGAFRQRASYSLAVSDQTSTNLILDPPYVARFEGRIATRPSTDFLSDSRAELRRHHASYQADWRLASRSARGGAQLLTLLADWDGERVGQENRLAATDTRYARDNFGFAAQHQVMWPRVFLILGGRIDRNDNFGTAAVPRATLVHVLRSPASSAFGETRVKVSGGTGIKEPTMLESFSISPFFRGNLELEPERSRSVEVGIDQRFAADRAKVELTWFGNRFQDIISLRTDPATFEAQYFNIGVTRARGIELVAEALATASVRTRASYTFLDSAIVETTAPGNVLFAEGAWAFRRPRHSGFAGATLIWRRLTADVSGVFVGRFTDSDFGLFNPSFGERPGHTTWNARLSVKVGSQVTGLLSIDNLTDEDYSEPIGYQPLRRVIRAGVRVAF